MNDDIVDRLLKRSAIRRQIPTRKSVQEGKPDRIADLLDEAAAEMVRLRDEVERAKKMCIRTHFCGVFHD